MNGAEWSGAGGRGGGAGALLAGHCLIRCTAWRGGSGRGPEVKYRPGQECGADWRGRWLWPGRPGRRCLLLLLKKSLGPAAPEPGAVRPVSPTVRFLALQIAGRVFGTVNVTTGFDF